MLHNPASKYRPFAPVRLRTSAAKRYKKVASASALIWRMLLVAEKSFRRLNSPELLPLVAEGVKYVNGLRAEALNADQKAAA